MAPIDYTRRGPRAPQEPGRGRGPYRGGGGTFPPFPGGLGGGPQRGGPSQVPGGPGGPPGGRRRRRRRRPTGGARRGYGQGRRPGGRPYGQVPPDRGQRPDRPDLFGGVQDPAPQTGGINQAWIGPWGGQDEGGGGAPLPNPYLAPYFQPGGGGPGGGGWPGGGGGWPGGGGGFPGGGGGFGGMNPMMLRRMMMMRRFPWLMGRGGRGGGGFPGGGGGFPGGPGGFPGGGGRGPFQQAPNAPGPNRGPMPPPGGGPMPAPMPEPMPPPYTPPIYPPVEMGQDVPPEFT